ncbi:MAG: VWA domain-containing protein [Akkermansiaceae bacterium]
MNLVFSNPWGFLALLGIPLLVVIYYLRRRAKVVTVTTLFLLKRTQRESKAGRRFETFSNSFPFWLQVLAVLLLTWLLVGPKYGESRRIRQIAIVVDSSASMQPVKEDLWETLSVALEKLKGDADEASFIVLDHDPKRARIYQGNDPEALLQRMEDWEPTDGALDPTASLRIGRSLVGPDGVLVYLTDHDGGELPQSAIRLALGKPLANCGFTGVTVGEEGGDFVWTAVVRNYGDSPQTREWTLETLDRKRSDPRSVTLAPRKLSVLRGKFPKGEERLILRLSGDAMTLDDVMPVIVGKPRIARMSVTGSEAVRELGARMIRGFAHLEEASEVTAADLVMKSVEGGEEAGSSQAAIIFYEGNDGKRPSGKWLAEEHELSKGLNFQALSIGGLTAVERRAGDHVILWIGSHPAILLRQDPISRAEQLVFLFELSASNAMKLPAIAAMLHRFCETVARETLSSHTATLETRQLLTEEFPEVGASNEFELIMTRLDGSEEELRLTAGFRDVQRTPAEPGFLSLSYGGKRLLDASVAFSDTREADLSRAVSIELPEVKAALVDRQSREDRWWRWIAMVVLVVMMVTWYFLKPSQKTNFDS